MAKTLTYTADILSATAKWLYTLELPAKISRHRGKLIKKMNEKLAEFDADKLEIVAKYCEMTDEHTVKSDGDGNIVFKEGADAAAFNKEFSDLLAEPLTLDFTELTFSAEKLIAFFDSQFDDKIGGNDAELFELLAEKLESITEMEC